MDPVVLDRAIEERAREVNCALASVRMEGLEPSAEAKAIFQRYADGALTLEQMSGAIDDLLVSEYGSIRLPRNGRP